MQRKHRARLAARIAALSLTLCCGAAVAAPNFHPEDESHHDDRPPSPIDEQVVVTIAPTTEEQLDEALELARGVWSERVGLGPFQIRLDESDLPKLRELGLEPLTNIDNLEDLILEERRQIEELRLQRGVGFYDNYNEFPDIVARMDDLAANNPNLASRRVIGQSVEGRNIEMITVTGPGDPAGRTVIFFNGGQHAREWVSPATVIYIAEQLILEYAADQRVTNLLDNAVIKIVPVANPDGYVYSWAAPQNRLWRKNRRDNGDGTFGVDLNRNWDTDFSGVGASPDTDSDIYHGPFAFSEPETSALRDVMLEEPTAAHIDFHNFSQLILYPPGNVNATVPAPDQTFFARFGEELSDVILSVNGAFYTPQPAIDLYPAAGAASDWSYQAGLSGWTIELRPIGGNPGFQLPPDQILPTATENYEAILTFAEQYALPLRIRTPVFTPSIVTSSDTPMITADVVAAAQTLDPTGVRVEFNPQGAGSPTMQSMAAGGTDGFATAFDTTLPAQPCGSMIEYAILADSIEGSTTRLPLSGAFTYEVIDLEFTLTDDAEAPNGWSLADPDDDATTGRWELADPEPTAAQPGDDFSPAGTNCYITEAAAGANLGSFDIDGGKTTLTSPLFDALGSGAISGGDAFVEFAVWFSNDTGGNPGEDPLLIEISPDDGTTWLQLESYNVNANQWRVLRYRINDVTAPTSQMRVRFIAADFGGGSLVEAGVDDVRVIVTGCPSQPTNPADLNTSDAPSPAFPNWGIPDGQLTPTDFSAFSFFFGSGDLRADLNSADAPSPAFPNWAVPDGLLTPTDFAAFSFFYAQGAP